MKVKYFHDTTTALIVFSTHAVVETKEINENIYIDLDAKGNLVAITIEHADLHANLPDLFYEQGVLLSPNHFCMNRQNPPQNIHRISRHLRRFQ